LPIFEATTGLNFYELLCILPQIAIDLSRLKNFGKDWKWIFINLMLLFGRVL
tara:strand:+ start:830 stop:985 length:156 start_codon:yes stop_codon:yes gene_type:complete